MPAHSAKFGFQQHINFFSILFNQTSYVTLSTSDRYFETNTVLDRSSWAKFFFYTKLTVSGRFYIVDGFQFATERGSWVVRFNLNNFSSDTRLSCSTLLLSSSFFLQTTSSSFKSSVWLERELSDFTGLNFLGLSDTRRLLLDYFEEKKTWQTHISNDKNYNNLIYDVTLAY